MANLLIIDLAASFVIMVTSFLVFWRTKEFYELSAHRGIKYFRYAFLFFGITFLLQFIRPFTHELIEHGVRFPIPLDILVFLFAGTMAVLCLLYSVLWKKANFRHPMLLMSLFALLVALIMMLARLRILFIILQVLLFIVVLIINHRQRGKLGIDMLYLLLFLSWIASVAASFTLWHSPILGTALNIVAATLFVVLFVKVLKRTSVRT